MEQASGLKYGKVTLLSLAILACLYGTKYSEGMFLSVEHATGWPDFRMLVKMIVVSNKASFTIGPYQARYIEHLWSYELIKNLLK